MRIAILNWTSRRVGGTETYLAGIAPALVRAGHEVLFMSETDKPAEREAIIREPALPAISVEALGVEAALDALRAWKPDVLYCHGLLSPALEARTLDIAPAVFFAHNYYGACISGHKAFSFPDREPCPHAFGPACLVRFYPRRCGGLSPITMTTEYLKQRARLELLPRYRVILTHSEHMRREFERYPGLEGRVLNSAYAVHSAHPKVPVTAPFSLDVPVHLAFVGRMDKLKGGDLLIEALPTVAASLGRAVALVLAGAGPSASRWRKVAARTTKQFPNVTVDFRGWSTTEEVRKILSASDLLVVPSLWPEPYGLVGLEAGRLGVPAVAFAVGGITDWLKEGQNGCLAPGDPPTADGLAHAIVRCLSDPHEHAALRIRAEGIARELDDSGRHIALLTETLSRVVAEAPAP